MHAGSTQEEMGSLLQAAVAEANTTGTNRPVAWDGQTSKGPVLHNQMRAIADQRVRLTPADTACLPSAPLEQPAAQHVGYASVPCQGLCRELHVSWTDLRCLTCCRGR